MAGADEAILLNHQGNVTEGSTDNIFILKNEVIMTPPVSDGALQGITREVLFELAAELGIPCHARSIAPYDLYTAEECFLSGTAMELIPVREIDGRKLTHCPGPLFNNLQQAFRSRIEHECNVSEQKRFSS